MVTPSVSGAVHVTSRAGLDGALNAVRVSVGAAACVPNLACTLHCGAARLPLPSLSVATFAGTSIVTVPVAAGVMMARVSPFVSAHPVTRPLPTVTSACTNPVTDSEKSMSTLKAPVCTPLGQVMVTVGSP